MRSPLIWISRWSRSCWCTALRSPGASRNTHTRTWSFSNTTFVPTPPSSRSCAMTRTLRSGHSSDNPQGDAHDRCRHRRAPASAASRTSARCVPPASTCSALVGRDPRRPPSGRSRFDVPHGLTDLAEALALPGVDAVAIATPPAHARARSRSQAIAAGKHVLCEKPFARDADEARPMLDAAEAAGVVHLLGTEFRWASGQASMARVVQRGEIGTPKLATFLHAHPDARRSRGRGARLVGRRRGRAAAGSARRPSHVIDQVRVMLGEFAGVSASLTQVSARDWDVEDAYTVHFRTRSGVDGVMQSTSRRVGTAGVRHPRRRRRGNRVGRVRHRARRRRDRARARSPRPTTSRSRRPTRRPPICS